jgi:hypothetical protein
MVSILSGKRMPCALPSLLFTLLWVTSAQAQAPGMTRPDPLDPKAQVPATRFESSFAEFRRLGDDGPVGWRDANEAVARIGGWRVYALESQQPAPSAAEKPMKSPEAPPSTPSGAASPVPAGHSGQKH